MAVRALIAGGVRTPIGRMNGALAAVPAPRLAAVCVRQLIERYNLPAASIDQVIMGCVIQAGLGQNPARQAAIHGGLSSSVPASTVNKVCGSGLYSVMLADQAIRLDEAGLILAGGMESMSRAPYLLDQARSGYRMGHGQLIDSMIHDGLWDVYHQRHMGSCGDLCAREHGFSRRELDDFAVMSHRRAETAAASGCFSQEIVPVVLDSKEGSSLFDRDEGLGRLNEPKLRSLKPAFDSGGTVTAGNASSIADGAAALVVGSETRFRELGIAARAAIVGTAVHAQEPQWFTTAPASAIEKLLAKLRWSVGDVDLFEINEAFAVVPLYAARAVGIPLEKVNVHGGAIALGHPIGASGARVLVTLLSALERTGGTRGVASLCLGGGEAVALAVELVEASTTVLMK